MRKSPLSRIVVSVLFTTSLFIFSCNEKKVVNVNTTSNTTTSTNVSNDVEVSKPAKKSPKTTNAVILYDGYTLCVENNEGKMIPTEETVSGTVAKLILENDKIVTKNAIRKLSTGKEDKFDFVFVEVNGEQYWTRDIFVTNTAVPAIVVKDNVRLYSSPDLSSPTKTILNSGSIVAKFSDESDFTGIYVYNGTPYCKEYYAKKGTIDTDPTVIDYFATEKRITELGDKIKPEVLEEIISIIKK